MTTPDENGWMPIETAPRDGTFVLVTTRQHVAGMVMAQWDSRMPYPAFVDEGGDSAFDAAYWQPLPPPPVGA